MGPKHSPPPTHESSTPSGRPGLLEAQACEVRVRVVFVFVFQSGAGGGSGGYSVL